MSTIIFHKTGEIIQFGFNGFCRNWIFGMNHERHIIIPRNYVVKNGIDKPFNTKNTFTTSITKIIIKCNEIRNAMIDDILETNGGSFLLNVSRKNIAPLYKEKEQNGRFSLL